MPRWAWSIGLVLSACATPEPPAAPAAGLEVSATLIAVEDSTGVAVRAFDGEEVGFSSEPALGASVVVLRYDRGLEALGLPRGPLALAPESAPGRTLPTPQEAWRGWRRPEGLGDWRSIDRTDAIFARVRLPDRGLDVCLEAEGCFRDSDDLAARVCTPGCANRRSPRGVDDVRAVAAPEFGRCPAGWTASVFEGANICTPAAPPECAADEASWPSTSKCERLGTSCPSSSLEWAPDLPPSRPVVYVRLGAQGGDGSRSAPWGTLSQAFAVAEAGDVIALGTGTFRGAFTAPDGVTIWGACVSGTRIDGEDEYGLTIRGAGSGVRNLTVSGRAGGLRVRGGVPAAHVQDVVVEGHELGPGVLVTTSSVTIRRLRVRGTVDAPASALHVEQGADVSIAQAMLDDNGARTVLVRGRPTRLELQDSVLTQVGRRLRTDGALRVLGGGQLSARGVLLTGYRFEAVQVQGFGSTVDLVETVISDVIEPGEGAAGVSVDIGARATLSRVLIEGVEGPALEARGGDIVADIIVLREGLGDALGMVRQIGGNLELGRTLVHEPRGLGIYSEGGTLTLRDVRVEAVRPGDGAAAPWARALEVEGPSEIDIRRLSIRGGGNGGVMLRAPTPGDALSGTLHDVAITDLQGQGDISAKGLWFGEGVRAELMRASLERIAGVGILAEGEAKMGDIRVEGVQVGLLVAGDGEAGVVGGHFQSSAGAGLCVRDRGVLTASDLRVLGVSGTAAAQSCSTAVDASGGGIFVAETGRVALRRYEVTTSAAAGLQVLGARGFFGSDGLVTNNSVGAILAAAASFEDALTRTQIFGNADAGVVSR